MSTSAIGATGMEASARPASGLGYFQKPLPVKLILASFFFLTLPVAAIVNIVSLRWLVALYLCLFGTTHFVITFSVYLRQENLTHFLSTTRNRTLFFGVPLLLFGAFYLVGVLRLVVAFPLFGLAFRAIVRLADFNHLNRQTFGVHQLFKARAGLRAPARLKTLENLFFLSLSAQLYCTFLAGGRTPLLSSPGQTATMVALDTLRPVAYAILVASVGLAVIVFSGLVRAWREAGRPAGFGDLLCYFGFQVVSASLAAISLPLYSAALAMHYVEYHVLMYPRCFHTRLDASSAVDRSFAWLRATKSRFYGALIAVSIAVYAMMITSLNLMGMDANPEATGYLAFAALFDGLFVFHYFIETLIWRFGDPFFRKEARLYFAAKS